MATVVYQIPLEIDQWIRARAERLANERGVERVPLATVVRELPAIVDAAESAAVTTKKHRTVQP